MSQSTYPISLTQIPQNLKLMCELRTYLDMYPITWNTVTY